MGMSIESWYDRTLAELLKEKALRPLPKRLRKWVLVDRTHICEADTRVMFVKSGFITGNYCSNLKNYDRAANKIGISRTEDC